MIWRRKRTAPTVTELTRIEQVLERDPALRRYLGTKTCPIRKRNGQVICFADATIKVAAALMARSLSPERAHVQQVLSVAAAMF